MNIDFEDIVPDLRAVNDGPEQQDNDDEGGYHPMLISAE